MSMGIEEEEKEEVKPDLVKTLTHEEFDKATKSYKVDAFPLIIENIAHKDEQHSAAHS